MSRFIDLPDGMSRRHFLNHLAGAAALAAPAAAQAPIKVGVLHSLSGTMAISESTLKDTVLMMIDDIRSSAGT